MAAPIAAKLWGVHSGLLRLMHVMHGKFRRQALQGNGKNQRRRHSQLPRRRILLLLDRDGFTGQMPADGIKRGGRPHRAVHQQTFQALIGICLRHCIKAARPLRALPPFTEGEGSNQCPLPVKLPAGRSRMIKRSPCRAQTIVQETNWA